MKGNKVGKTKFVMALLAPFWFAAAASGQGTLLRITFDGPPVVPPGVITNTHQYYESGMLFIPTPTVGSFERVGFPADSTLPNDGTAYVRAVGPQGLFFSFLDGSAFAIVSVDLAGPNTSTAGVVDFVGYHPDGSTVTAYLVAGGSFQTFNLGAGFTDLTSVNIPSSPWSLDNLVLSVPEPGIGTLVFLGGLAVCASRWCHRDCRSSPRTPPGSAA